MPSELGTEGLQISPGLRRRGGRKPEAHAETSECEGEREQLGNSLELILVGCKRSLLGGEVDRGNDTGEVKETTA